MRKVEIIMGSDSDLEIMSESAKILEEFGVPYKITIGSAHRSPEIIQKYATAAGDLGIKVIIAGAGGAAHLAGVLASLTTLPIIGVPIKTKNLNGFDSLLSTIEMPPGVPVATVGINAAKNAGILAVEILATSDKNLENKLVAYKAKMSDEIKLKREKFLKIGYEKYLKNKQIFNVSKKTK